MSNSEEEIQRLKNELHVKDETLNQLKLKTKAFVDNMRTELSVEKKKVAELEEQLKHATTTTTTTRTTTTEGNTMGNSTTLSNSSTQEEMELLKKELAAVTSRENDLKTRAKTFADTMKQQLASEKEKVQKLEQALVQAKEEVANFSSSQQFQEQQAKLHAAELASVHEKYQNQLVLLNNEYTKATTIGEQKQQQILDLTQELLQFQKNNFNHTKKCENCEKLTQDLTEMSNLYEKVNLIRSQNDVQLEEIQFLLKEKQIELDFLKKEMQDKKNKAKEIILSLTNEKNFLIEKKNEFQKENERLLMEIHQNNLEEIKKTKKNQEENYQKIQEITNINQKLQEEIQLLQKNILFLQENDHRSQQRLKEITNAKKEVEESNKKRLAAKAEIQKIANELENIQKYLFSLTEQTNTNCIQFMKTIWNLQEKIIDALQFLEKNKQKKQQKQKQKQQKKQNSIIHFSSSNLLLESSSCGSTSTGNSTEKEEQSFVVDSSSPREKVMSPALSVKRVEENIARVNEKLLVLVEVTEKLCDLSVEQNEINLKEVLLDRVSSVFGQCFPERLRPSSYAQVEDAMENFESLKPSSSSNLQA